MIICSCNVLSEAEILATLKRGANVKPRSPGEAYRCLGCAPRCGRCLASVRALLAQAHLQLPGRLRELSDSRGGAGVRGVPAAPLKSPS